MLIVPKGGHHVQHSYPVLVTRRGQGRRLPPTPAKPSTLQLKPSNINFPKLNASPTHVSDHFRPNAIINILMFGWLNFCFGFVSSFTPKHIIRRHTVIQNWYRTTIECHRLWRYRCRIHVIICETTKTTIIGNGYEIVCETMICDTNTGMIKSFFIHTISTKKRKSNFLKKN